MFREQTAGRKSHFWISTYPFFESTLFIYPSVFQNRTLSVSLRFHDSDGNQFNEAQLEFPAGQVGIVELEQFMAWCKIECGFKHAHLIVESNDDVRLMCRMHNAEGGAVLGEPVLISSRQGGFFPMLFKNDRLSFVGAVNNGVDETVLRCRLFSGKRTPETSVVIPPLGARLINIQSEFPEYAAIASDIPTQAYVRLSTKSDHFVGVQLVECIEGRHNGQSFFSSVS